MKSILFRQYAADQEILWRTKSYIKKWRSDYEEVTSEEE